MSTHQSRLTFYVSKRQHARLKEHIEDTGQTVADYIRGLVEADLNGNHEYMLRLMGHRIALMSVQVGALARREFEDLEYQRLRTMAVSMGAAAFGPLPSRPYDFEQLPSEDERIEALHALLDPTWI